ncbi:MAG TPA: DUF1080 domain-containing protein, partial [Phycisphaerales bacterium]|nr:DUF1080 domain-containing protein [Phycisphaerales bacterium]
MGQWPVLRRWLVAASVVVILGVVVPCGCQEVQKTDAGPKWVKLFNGKDLTGWTPKFKGCDLGVNYKDTFRVEDGVLKVCYDKYDRFDSRFGHIFYEHSFSHYRIKVEYRFVGEQVAGGPGWAFRNNGIMLHCQDPKTMTKDQDFPNSIEVQLLGGDGKNKRPTCNLCTPGTHVVIDGKLEKTHCINSSSETFHGDQWVTAEVEVRGGDVIRHFVNGKQVMEYEKPQLDSGQILTSGWISLQAESHPTEFRRIELLPL